jgi:uncharacterized membrane protein (UPF0182 family)
VSALQELRRRWWLLLLGAVVLILLFATRVATFYTDVLWFESIGFVHVFWTLLTTRIGIGGVGALLAFLLLAANLLIAKRLAPPYRIPSPQEESIERYREALEPFARPLLLGVAVVVGGLSGLALSANWDTVLLYLNRVPFGMDDPHFGRDIGYFVFELPFLELVNSWLFTSLALTIALTAVAHYLFGGIRPQSPGQKVTPQVNVHLSVLLAALVAVRAWGFVLDQYLLSFSERGTVTGLSYTDVNAQLLAFQLLAVIAAVCVVLFLLNIRFRTWLLPAGGIGILVVCSLVLSGIYPAVIQRLQVEPQELPREREFIDRNLEMTRFGFDLADVETSSFPANASLEDSQVIDNAPTLESLRLWDPATLQTTFQQLQEFRPYYDFRDVDVDRYRIDDGEGGERLQQVMISVREISERDLPTQSRTWQNERLFFTHGYGLVASDVSTARGDGQPVFLVNDIPPTGVERLEVENPRIYFGENPPEYSIVNTAQLELDYPTEDGTPVLYDYTGEDGVGTGSFLRRLSFGLRYAEPNFVLSDLIEPRSKILFNRNIRQRVEAVAPFLKLDHDPYPVAVDGRIKWIQDAYTTTDMIPYSERVDLGALTIADQRQFVTAQTESGELVVQERTVERAGIEGRANYIRNSVKAVVDAYDGTVELYVVDDEDPLIQAWQQVFPESFTAGSEASDDLQAHFRYPEDMFRVQAEQYRLYHIPEADEFYTREDAWDIPIDAAFSQNQQAAATQRSERDMRPYYLLMRLPGEQDEEFALIQPFNPAARPNLIGWLAARSDGDALGQLRAYLMPPDRTVFGPQQVQARIDQDGAVAQQITLWNQSGSRVIYGNLLVIPVDDSLLYVQPLFLRAQQSQIPELRKIVLVLGDEVVMEDTLAESLASLFGDVAPGVEGIAGAPDAGVGAPDPDDADAEGQIDPRVATLIRQALEAFADAENALREGDLATYAERTREAGELLEQAQNLTGDDDPIELPGGPDESEDGDADEGEGATGGGGVDEIEPSPGPSPGQDGTGEDA